MSTIVITGANRGIGLELARARAKDHEVVALVREPSEALRALGVRIEAGLDAADGASIDRVAARLEAADVLINNAGIMRRSPLHALDWDGIDAQMRVNAYAPLRLSAALAPKMSAGSKIAIVTSRMGSIGDNTSGGAYGYRMSKVAVNMAGASLAHDLRPRGIAVAILHPGHVRTEMTGGTGPLSAAESAAMLWARIDALTLETSGTFWHANGEVLPW